MDINLVKVLVISITPFPIFFATYYFVAKDYPKWFIRKFIHTIGLVMVAIYPSFLNNVDEIIVTISIVLFGVIILTIHPKLKLFYFLIKNGTRDGEKQIISIINTVLTVTTALILLTIFYNNLWIFTASILTVGIGDGFGEFFGRKFGKHKYKIIGQKSIEGSLAVFVFSFMGILFTLFFNGLFATSTLLVIILASICVTVVEALSTQFMDNVLMPITSSLILYFLL